MKTKILFCLATLFLFVAMFTACKKENSKPNDDNSVEASVQSDDQSRFSSEIDAVANDADLALENSSSFTGRTLQSQQDSICDATAVYDLVNRKITITYNGANCGGFRSRTGTVVLSMASGIHWKDQGASITVAFQNLKITRVADNKSITINGTQTYTNVSGHLLIDLFNPLSGIHSVTHTITSSDMSIVFDDGTQRNWQVAKQRVYSFSNANISITITGTHSEGDVTNIAEWGTNRLGHEFTTSTVEPIVITSNCGFRIVSGELKHTLPNLTATATFGLDSHGDPTSCPGTGHYYFKVVVTGSNGNSITVIMPY
jgi:hypothetical protein